MARESDAMRLAALRAHDSESFDTGAPSYLEGVLTSGFEAAEVGEQEVEVRVRAVECRSADVLSHRLVKKQPLRRVSTGIVYYISRLEDDGQGWTTIILDE